jgi:hypothetical protein
MANEGSLLFTRAVKRASVQDARPERRTGARDLSSLLVR